MFNYVVKDPDSSGLSREFWIKDQVGRATLRVLELVCAFVYVESAHRSISSGLDSTRLLSLSSS